MSGGAVGQWPLQNCSIALKRSWPSSGVPAGSRTCWTGSTCLSRLSHCQTFCSLDLILRFQFSSLLAERWVSKVLIFSESQAKHSSQSFLDKGSKGQLNQEVSRKIAFLRSCEMICWLCHAIILRHSRLSLASFTLSGPSGLVRWWDMLICMTGISPLWEFRGACLGIPSLSKAMIQIRSACWHNWAQLGSGGR